MTDRRTFILAHDLARRNAMRAVADAPPGYVIEVKPKTRSLEQNSRMWAMLGDISKQVRWYGQTMQPVEWKDMLTAGLKKQKVVPGIDGGFVVVGASTSQMSVKEMTDLIDLMGAFGAERGVVWSGEEVAA